MKQTFLNSPEQLFPPKYEQANEKFFNLRRTIGLHSRIDSAFVKFHWHSCMVNSSASLVMVVQGIDSLTVDEFITYISARIKPTHLPNREEIICEVSKATVLENHDTYDSEKDALPLLADENEQAQKIRHGMMDQIDSIIEANLDNEEFRVNDLAKGLNYCPMQVHRIIKELTKLSSAQYIRFYRLKKSQVLLLSGKYNVNEVAYMVGFKSPEHFAKSFRKEFGKCPSAFKHL